MFAMAVLMVNLVGDRFCTLGLADRLMCVGMIARSTTGSNLKGPKDPFHREALALTTPLT